MAEGKRPRLMVLVGSLMLIRSGVLAFKMIRFLARWNGPVVLDARDVSVLPSWLVTFTQFVSGHMLLIACFGLVESAFILIAATCFLVGRPWARVGLEAECWFELTLLPVSAIYAYAVRQILHGWGSGLTSGLTVPQVTRLAGTLPRLPDFLFRAAWLALFIAILRSRSVRKAPLSGSPVLAAPTLQSSLPDHPA
jgi:hypothetical protein